MRPYELNENYIKLNPDQRLYNCDLPVIGLTGGIGSGKSSATKYLRSEGLHVICADELIKEIYQKSESIAFISQKYPSAVIDGEIDFSELRKLAFNTPEIKQELENFLYPQLKSHFEAKVKEIENQKFVIYDVPLLFEKKMEGLFDLTLLIACDSKDQIQRVKERDGSSDDVINKIIESQVPMDQKRKMADIVIENNKDIKHLYIEIDLILFPILKKS